MSVFSTRPCEHDVLIRLLLDALFPEQTAWTSLFRRQRGDFDAKTYRLTSPSQIRNVMAVQLRKIDIDNASFGENVIDVILTRDEPSGQRVNVASCTTPEDDLSIANELLYALRLILANQRPHHEPLEKENKRPLMDHTTCERRTLPVLTVHFSERYCYHTVYWLCEILSLMCARFAVTCNKQPFPCVPRCAESSRVLLKPTNEHMSNYRSASHTVLRNFLMLRGSMTAPLCRACVRLIFVKLTERLSQVFSPHQSDHVYDIL